MLMRMLRLLLVVLLLLCGCGGAAEVGEECDRVGMSEECVRGAICDSVEGDEAVCLAICDDQEDCAEGEDCNGVSGSNIKACHPR